MLQPTHELERRFDLRLPDRDALDIYAQGNAAILRVIPDLSEDRFAECERAGQRIGRETQIVLELARKMDAQPLHECEDLLRPAGREGEDDGYRRFAAVPQHHGVVR